MTKFGFLIRYSEVPTFPSEPIVSMGYEHDETDIRVVDKEIVMTPIRKIYPPDTTAAIFWLKNRRPEQWRETKAVELTGAQGGPVGFQMIERRVIDAGN